MIRNDDIVEDFVPTEQYSMHTIPNTNSNNELGINHQFVESDQNCEITANNSLTQNNFNSIRVHEIGFHGWRKRCLYCFVLLVTITVVINAGLTLWIIAVLSFSMDGIGKVKIQSNGLQLSGEALLLNNVYANNVRSRKDHNLRIQSDNRVILNARNTNSDSISDVLNRLNVANSRVNGIANQFVVKSPDERLLFLVSDTNVVVATDRLRVNNAAGIRFNGSIQVPLVQSNTEELNVLSQTRRIRIKGPQKVFIKSSSSANLLVSSINNLYFRSKEKIIHLDSNQIQFNNMGIAYPTKRGRTYPAIYQLCICAESGKLFIVPPEASCVTDSTVC